jgi:hypothetical protein
LNLTREQLRELQRAIALAAVERLLSDLAAGEGGSDPQGNAKIAGNTPTHANGREVPQ